MGETETPNAPRRPRVVILGGGFAGIGAARQLKDVDADIVLVDKNDFHTFQPLLYQVAANLLQQAVVGHPLGDLLAEHSNTTVEQATVAGIALEERRVHLVDSPPLSYDYLVIALGAEVDFFGLAGGPEHAFPMYTLADALRLREHVSRQWAEASRDDVLIEDGALNVVVVGGGPTGVETAGALAERYRTSFASEYPTVAGEKARIILVEAAASLFGMFRSTLRSYAKKELEKRGVEVLLGELVGIDRAHASPAQVRQGPQGAYSRLGRGPPGEPHRRSAAKRAAARQPHRRRARPQPLRSSGGLPRRRHRMDHRYEDQRRPSATRLGCTSGRRASG